MNEQAIIDSYNLFVQNGYKKSLQEYKQLLASNPNALNDSYGLFQQNGYKKSLNEFKVLMGVGGAAPVAPSAQVPASGELKKKEDTTALPSEVGSSVSSVSAEPEMPEMAQFEYQPGKPLPEQIPSVQPEPKQVELETNPIVSFGKKFWETLSKQIPSAMAAKGAQRQSQFVESDMRRLKSIAEVSDDDIIEMPSLTDPRAGNLTSYKAGEYKRQLAEKKLP